MSMDRCDKCGTIFDTDDDPDCYRDERDHSKHWENFTEDGVCLCQSCREDESDE